MSIIMVVVIHSTCWEVVTFCWLNFHLLTVVNEEFDKYICHVVKSCFVKHKCLPSH